MSANSLICEELAKSYGSRTVLSGVDLSVAAGSLTAVLGASGSGKTTLLRVVGGFEAPDSGRVLVGEVCIEGKGMSVPPERRGIGYVAQEGALFPHLSVGANVGFGLPRRQRRSSARIDEVLELAGLSASFARRMPHELSGGEQRRVALARALAPGPAVILLDEPFSGLDAGLRAETRRAVVNALAASGTTALLVTHDQAEAMSMGKEVAVLRDGRLAQTATPAELYRNPIDVDVASFVGEAVVIPGQASGSAVTCALGTLPIPDGGAQGRVIVMIRPEQISVSEASDNRAGVTGAVVNVEFLGADSVVSVSLDGVDATARARVRGHRTLAPGDEVVVGVTGEVRVYPGSA